jgi:hypothetical protein
VNEPGVYDELGGIPDPDRDLSPRKTGGLPPEPVRELGKRKLGEVREVLDKAIPAPTDKRELCDCGHELKYHARGRCFHPDETGVDCGCETPQRGEA